VYVMDVIVVGVGGVGSMAAWRLAAAGHRVTALEQFGVDHDRGSSYGDSRIVRRVYPSPLYTGMMALAYDLWDRLIVESGDSGLFVRCGGVFFGPSDNADVAAAERALADSGVAYERLAADECMRRFPAMRLAPDEVALFEPSMGYARASRAVRAAVRLAEEAGASIRENCAVTEINVAGERVRLRTSGGETIEADRLVIAPGPWAAPLLAPLGVQLPVTVTRQPYVHFEPARDKEMFEAPRFPVWIDAGANAYGFPRLGDIGGVKIGIHDYGALSDPETVDRSVNDADRGAARAYAARRFPSLGSEIVYEKVCLYTVTPDNDFIVDTVPGAQNILVISACSGHGFKFTPLMGQLAADFVDGARGRCDLSPFRLSRFAGNDRRRGRVIT
jgi:sarcosine oxidase